MEKNIFRFLPYLSLLKTWNLLKVSAGYLLSLFLKKPVVLGQPFYLHIEATNRCNLKCIECPTGMGIITRPRGNLSFENFKTCFDPVKSRIIYLVLYFQGEPFLNPELLKMIKYAKKNRVYTMVSSNGHQFRDKKIAREVVNSGLGSLVISFDGISQQSYQKYRKNGDLFRVFRGIDKIVEAKKELKLKYPKIYLQFLVMRHNEHEIEDMKRIGKKIGADRILFKTAQIYDFKNAEEILPQNLKYRRYVKIDNRYELKGKMLNRCFKLWSDSVITWDGSILPCCFDKNAEFRLGSLEFGNGKIENFQQIWSGPEYQKFRKQILTDRKQIPICSNCSEGISIFAENV